MDPYTTAKSVVSQNAAPKERSAIDSLHSSLEHLAQATTMVSSIASDLVGPVPTGVGQDGESGADGLIGSVQRAADRVNALAGSIIDDMQRIQRRL